jgi:hypothetical protein
MTTSPKTAAQAAAILETLQAKRLALLQTIDSGTFRRRGLATKAEFGDAEAGSELRTIAAEEAEARRRCEDLDVVTAEIEEVCATLQAKEKAARASTEAVQLAMVVDKLLEIDDELDDLLDQTRELLAKREDFKRENSQILRRAAAGKLPGGRDHEIADSIMAYFDRYLNGYNAGRTFAAITRIADFDSRYYGRSSARQLERGPRPLTAFEQTFRQAFAPCSAPTEVAIPRQATRR